MGRAFKIVGWAVGAVLIVILAAFWALQRGDIPYATLEQRYGAPTSHYLDLPDGLHVHYRDEGDPKGPVLVLVHGYSASAADWDDWAKRLGDHYHIIAPDLPGHGLTRAPKGYRTGPEVQVKVVDAVTEALGLRSFVIAGNSMGGGVAWRYTLAHPEKVAGLVLVDAAGWPSERKPSGQGALIFSILNNPVLRPLVKNMDVTGLAKQGLESALVDKALVTPTLVKRYTDLARGPGHRDLLTQGYDRTDVASAERLAPIKAPTLIMFGKEDHLIPYTDGQRFKDAINGSTLIIYPEVGHVPMQQIPDQSAKDLRAWMTALPGVSATAANIHIPITVRELPPARAAR